MAFVLFPLDGGGWEEVKLKSGEKWVSPPPIPFIKEGNHKSLV